MYQGSALLLKLHRISNLSFKFVCQAQCGTAVVVVIVVSLFQVVLTSDVTPPQTTGWKVTVAAVLLLLLFASSVQLSLVANITKLPKV